jgi:hypothetical protein
MKDDSEVPHEGNSKVTRPTHYKTVCLSIYTTDLHALDRKVVDLKQRGWARANRSHLIRIALSRLTQADLEAIALEQRGLP